VNVSLSLVLVGLALRDIYYLVDFASYLPFQNSISFVCKVVKLIIINMAEGNLYEIIKNLMYDVILGIDI
jgi:hypothetical protein